MKYNLEIVIETIKSSCSYVECMRKLGRRTRGSSVTHFKKFVEKHELNTSHFKRLPTRPHQKQHWSHHLVNGVSKSSNVLKRCMVEAGVDYICNGCGCGPIWNNKKLVLQIEHKDGDHLNNDLQNLEFLCPNCHSQTETWGTLKNHSKTVHYCKCGKIINKKNSHCVTCTNKLPNKIQNLKNKTNTKCPSKEILEKLVWELPTTKIAAQFGVSDNAIGKWCKKLNVDKPGPGYWTGKLKNQ